MPAVSNMAARCQQAPLLVTLLLVFLLHHAASAEFGVGFVRWPAAEVVAVPGSSVTLSCATNVTADKISWQYNHHFLLAPPSPASSPAPHTTSSDQAGPPSDASRPAFEVREAEDRGSELVVNLAAHEAQYRHQLGLYQCVAWFGAIALTSLPGRLMAAVLEEFPAAGDRRLREVAVLEDGAVRVECGLPNSVPEAQLKFYKDGQLLNTSSQAYLVTPHGDLLVLAVGSWAAGEYRCEAHNPVLGHSVALPTATLVTVLPRTPEVPPTAPQFISLRALFTAHAGSNMSLPCAVSGHPQPSVRWSRYGGSLPHTSSQAADGSLLLVQLTIQDEGTYLCHANNGVGAEVLLDVALEVLEPASIIEAPQSQAVEEGSAIMLACRAHGHPPPKVMWVFNGHLVRNGNVLVTENGLSIGAVKKDNAGIFQCFAHNPEGTVQGVAMVSVVPKTVTAAPGVSNNSPEYGAVETSDTRQWHSPPQGSSGLGNSGGSRGQGGGGKGHGHNHRRKPEEPMLPGDTQQWNRKKKKGRMVPPSRPRMTKVSDESVMVSWDGPNTTGLPVLFYKIQYKLVRSKGNRGSHWMTVDEDINPHVSSYEVTGLQAGRTYRFRIAAVYANNDNKRGPNSRRFLLEKEVRMQRPAYPPTIVSLLPQGPTTVRLHWQYQEPPASPVSGFFISYREATLAGDYMKMTVLGPEKRSLVVSHLKANVSYDFKIQSFNLAGPSDFSPIYKKSIAGLPATSTEAAGTQDAVLVPVVTTGGEEGGPSQSHLHLYVLYVILAGALGLLFLVVVVSATVYNCRNKQADEDTRSVKYEDTSLHIHREAATYTLPEAAHCNNQAPNNGYLPHQGITVTKQTDEKVAMESSFTENNNHNGQHTERCYHSPARRIAAQDSAAIKSSAVTKTSDDSFVNVTTGTTLPP